MSKEKNEKSCTSKKWNGPCGDAFGWVYFLSVIGAAVYYVQASEGFWMGVMAVLKAIVWPAFMIYEVLDKLGM